MKLRPSRFVYQSATLAEPTCVLRGGTFAITTARLLLVSLPVVACGQDQDDSGAVPLMPSTPTVPSISTGSVPISPPNGASTLDMGQTSAEPTAGGTGVDVSPGEVSPSVGPAATEDTSGASTTGDNPVPAPSTNASDSTAPPSDGSDDATSDGENSTEPAGDTSTPVDDSTGDDSSSVAPTVDPTQVEGELASLPCGARYTALGDGGWNFCLRLQDGGGACAAADSANFTRVTFGDGTPVSDVAQVIGAGTGDGVMVATTDGALYAGGSPSNVSLEPLISSGVVNISAGANPRVALIKDGDGFTVMAWADGGSPAPVNLPNAVKPVQVSANYGLACALDTQGDVYCWEAGGNHQIEGVTTTPSQLELGAPSKMVSVGQNSVCAISFDDTLQCTAHWYSSPWLPTRAEDGNVALETSSFPSVRDVTAGYHQGIIVKTDGTAYYLGHTDVGSDNPGVAFTGASNVVASGGDRGRACVQTDDGSVYCITGSSTTLATVDGQALKAEAAACPY